VTSATAATTNPYVGPRAFVAGEVLYGRQAELERLLDLFIAERIVLLYSPSGAGKTSLIQAGLIPELKREGFNVLLPVIRVNLELPTTMDGSLSPNRYVFSTLSSLEEGREQGRQLGNDQLAPMTLQQYLDGRVSGDGGAGNEVLIFDQFEEILTLDPTDKAAKETFFQQVGAALRDRGRWALFAMREDHVAGLDPYLELVPTRLSTTFRLDLLGPEAAREAVIAPARDAGVHFSEAAATRVVDDLRRVRVQRPAGSVEELGPHIEPVQLQVVCRQLWGRSRADPSQITEHDVVAMGNVDSALADYYEERVAAIARSAGASERSIRDWFDHALITEQGFRTQVLLGPGGENGDHTVVNLLRGSHLVRAERRRGATWYELAHDRLIEPIQASNRLWREHNLGTLERQAALWDSQDRQPGLLLSDQALVDAERWAESRPDELSSVEKEFLAACRQARAAAERERRSARTFRRLTVGLGVVSVLAVSALLWGWKVNDRARDERERATARQLAAHVFSKFDERLDRSLLLDVEAFRGQQSAETRSALLNDLQRAPQLTRFLHSPRALEDVALRPDGELVAAGRDDGVIELWDPRSGRPLGELRGHGGRVGGLTMGPGGDLLASASDDTTVIVWDLRAQREVATLRGHQHLATSVAFSPDGRLVATASADGTVMLWNLGNAQNIATLRGHRAEVTTVAFSPDGEVLASGSIDQTVILWDRESTRQLGELRGHTGAVRSVAFSSDGTMLASGGNDTKVLLWSVERREQVTTLTGHTEFVRTLAFSPDGRILASGAEDKRVILWDLTTGGARERSLAGHSDYVTGVGFSADASVLASSSLDHSLILWNVERDNSLGEPLLGHGDSVSGVTFSADGRTVASTSRDGTVRVWNAEVRRPRVTLDGTPGLPTSVASAPGGERLAVGSDAGTVAIWDVARREVVATLTGHEGAVTSVTFSPNGRTLASGGADHTVRLWNADTLDPQPPLTDQPAAVTSVAFSPDSVLLAAANDSGTITLWNVANRNPAAVLPRSNGVVNAVAFSRDGNRLASGGEDGTIIIWDTRTFQPRDRRLAGHAGPVTGVTFSADNRTLASSGKDGSVILWDIPWSAPTRPILGQPLRHHRGAATAVAFSPDGRQVASAGTDGVVVLWDTDPASWQRRACSIANRNLLRDEWDRFIGPGRSFRRTCPAPPGA
jgi:WD40 repeat protein